MVDLGLRLPAAEFVVPNKKNHKKFNTILQDIIQCNIIQYKIISYPII